MKILNVMDIFYPAEYCADVITQKVFSFQESSYVGSAVHFFIYDSIKIGFLLVIINYLMAVIRFYLPVEKLKDILVSRRWYGFDYLLAALFGVITPFCSCSSIPLFIGFLGAGIPIGVTLTFLISSPLVNEASLVLFPTILGLKVTLLYNILGISVAMLGGFVLQKFHAEKYVNNDLLQCTSRTISCEDKRNTKTFPLRRLLIYFWEDGFAITKKIYPYVIVGIALGALIHGFVPEKFIQDILSQKEWWVIPVATVIGIPLYANSVSVIPVVEALIGKGIPLGAILAFMTATVTVSIPEVLILKRAMKWQLLSMFFGITFIGIMSIGYFFLLVNM